MIDPESVWKDLFALIPQDPTGATSPTIIATYVATRVSLKLQLDPKDIKFEPPPLYTWVQGPFEAALRQIATVPTSSRVIPATTLANGWAQSTAASQLIIMPGAQMNKPPPGTNGLSSVATAVVEPSTIATGVKNIISELSAAEPTANQRDSKLPVAIRNAFLGLKFVVNGADTTAPTPIPFALLAAAF